MNQYHTESVWNPAIRIWHWLLALSVISGWLIGEFRTFSIMQWHFYAGYCTGTLLLVRIYWGFFGKPSSRFSTLIPTPISVVTYLKELFQKQPSGVAGHSPLGSIAVIVMLGLLIFQVCTGLISEDDDLFFEGPLASWVSSDTTGKATSLHRRSAKLLLIMFGLHVGIMLFYFLWKKENLVKAMITGKKLVRSIEK